MDGDIRPALGITCLVVGGIIMAIQGRFKEFLLGIINWFLLMGMIFGTLVWILVIAFLIKGGNLVLVKHLQEGNPTLYAFLAWGAISWAIYFRRLLWIVLLVVIAGYVLLNSVIGFAVLAGAALIALAIIFRGK